MTKRPFSQKSAVAADLKSAFEYHVFKTTSCWIWMGPVFKHRGGYGSFTARKFGIVQQRAHRIAWRIYCGEITSDQHVLHSCDNPLCVCPDHLFLGDQPTNMDDKVAKNRQTKGETHGPHKLTEQEAIAVHGDPRPYADIAEHFGISVPTVSDIKRGRSWKHLNLHSTQRYKL